MDFNSIGEIESKVSKEKLEEADIRGTKRKESSHSERNNLKRRSKARRS